MKIVKFPNDKTLAKISELTVSFILFGIFLGVLHEFSWIKTDGSYPAYGGSNVDSNTLVSSTW